MDLKILLSKCRIQTRGSFGERLQLARLKAKLSQTELGRVTKLDSTYLSRLESGRHYPNIKTLLKLCNALKTSADFLLGVPDYEKENDTMLDNNDSDISE